MNMSFYRKSDYKQTHFRKIKKKGKIFIISVRTRVIFLFL